MSCCGGWSSEGQGVRRRRLPDSGLKTPTLRSNTPHRPEAWQPRPSIPQIDEIWITFADPQPQLSREKKRLTFPGFLAKYKILLSPGGKVNLKTDNDGLYSYTCEKVDELGLIPHKSTADLYKSEFADEVLSIKTHYERIYLKHDKNINYIQFSFA